MRLTIDEYSKHFKMSKEMINSKLRTKKLNYIIENGIKYIIIIKDINDQNEKKQISQEEKKINIKPKALIKPKTTVAIVLTLYQRENKQLKEKILQLENKVDKLIDDKEQMLRDERNKIEQIYNTKDDQLKCILELINKKLLLEQESRTIHEIEAYQNKEDTKKSIDNKPKLIELRDYLKTLDLKSNQKKIIKKRFFTVYDSDIRITQQNGNLYLDFSKYDYSDLLAH